MRCWEKNLDFKIWVFFVTPTENQWRPASESRVYLGYVRLVYLFRIQITVPLLQSIYIFSAQIVSLLL